MTKNISSKKTVRAFWGFVFLGFALFLFPRPLDSANLSSVADTLETSRLSFHGKNAEQLTEGTTVVKMATSGTPSTSTANLFSGDTIKYTATSNTYTVHDIIDSDEFSITSALNAADDDANDEFVVVRNSSHTVTLTTASAIPNGAIKVRVKADSSNFNDSFPDDDGWDFNSISGTDVTCPADVPSYYDFVAGTATVSGGSGCDSGYHCFECRYSGPGNPSQSLTMTIGGSTKLINPSAASGHTEGTADTYSIIVDNLNASYAAVDSTTVKVAVIESVRVTATVDPIISFSIASLSTGATACGNALDETTTATAVPFGSVLIDNFTDLGQDLTVTTNASGGYAVTAVENDRMTMVGATAPEIPDLVGGSHSSEINWTSTATKGFGYSLENVDANSVTFSYGGAGNFNARQFPATSDAESPVTIFSSSTIADSENVYVCYRIIVSAAQQAGKYWNAVTYRATATF